MIIYGIKNCDTVKKSLQWLKDKNIDFEFHDYKTKAITETKLKEWVRQVGWETLINKKGTTWRKLEDAVKDQINDEQAAIVLMLNNTSLIKRPVIEKDNKVVFIGFDEQAYLKIL